MGGGGGGGGGVLSGAVGGTGGGTGGGVVGGGTGGVVGTVGGVGGGAGVGSGAVVGSGGESLAGLSLRPRDGMRPGWQGLAQHHGDPMSALFKLILDGVEREVEITRTGELVVLDYDLAWDDMLVAMGGQKSGVQQLLDDWQAKPCTVICKRMGLEHRTLVRLACGWVEHVLPVFETARPGDLRPRDAISMAVAWANGGEAGEELVSAAMAAARAADAADNQSQVEAKGEDAEPGAYAAAQAAQAASEAAYTAAIEVVLSRLEKKKRLERARERASEASVYALWAAQEVGGGFNDYSELDWQVRHFVHAMECVQAGKDWPSITETP